VLDSSGAKALHGIAINNLNQARPFTGVEVSKNTFYGAELNDPNNHISGALILVRGASNTLVSGNILRRSTYCILLDSGSSNVTVSGNQLSTCGSGSTEPVRILDSSNNQILNNKLWADPANFKDFSQVSRNIIELGASDHNVFRGNDAALTLRGPHSVRR
jgi:parallel beta-helix repeat protein